MPQILLLLAFNALLIEGVWFCTGPEQIGAAAGSWLQFHTPQWICKPLCQCRQCMSSFWGTLVFFTFGAYFLHLPLWMWPFYCLALCGLISLVHQIPEL